MDVSRCSRGAGGRACYLQDVVFPVNILKSNRVDPLVEEKRDIDHQEHDSQALGADSVRQDLDGVAHKHAGPCDVVEKVIDVNEALTGQQGRHETDDSLCLDLPNYGLCGSF